MRRTHAIFEQWQEAERQLRNAESRLPAHADPDRADAELGRLRAAVADNLQFALSQGLRGKGASIHLRSGDVPLDAQPGPDLAAGLSLTAAASAQTRSEGRRR